MSLKQVFVAPSADQKNLGRGHIIDQQPISIDVALPNSVPLAGQSMRIVSGWKGAFLGQNFDNRYKFLNVPAASFLTLEVVAELPSLCNASH
jgi:hypothetical protein